MSETSEEDLGPAPLLQGCQAVRFVMGIEFDGAVKGCPSLQTTSDVGGHARAKPLAEVWPAVAIAPGELWGFCKECDFAAVCQGGRTFTAHAFFGRPGNNPYCHDRAQVMARRGMRERLVLREAPAPPLDHAVSDLVLEAFGEPDVRPESRNLVKLRRKA